MVELIDAWTTWLAGERVAQLWGVPMLWWARWGLIIQFFSVLSIAIEVIGYERFMTGLYGYFDLLDKAERTRPLRLLGKGVVVVLMALVVVAIVSGIVGVDAIALEGWVWVPYYLFLITVYGLAFAGGIFLFSLALASLLAIGLLEKLVKVASIIALSVGFHFSLLAAV